MCPLQSRPSSDSDGYAPCQDRIADALAQDAYQKVVNDRYQSIRIANHKVKLISTLHRYGINVMRSSAFDAWSAPVRCPFPFHKGGNERTPSFAYNFDKDYFNCLGCQKGGGTVEFISYKDGVDKFSIAEQILAETGGYRVDEIDLPDSDPKIDNLLFQISKFFQTLVAKHRSNQSVIDQIEKVIWWFDLYISIKAPKQKISVEDLEERFSKVKELLERFE